jgi:hypothetical protein
LKKELEETLSFQPVVGSHFAQMLDQPLLSRMALRLRAVIAFLRVAFLPRGRLMRMPRQPNQK